MKKQYLRISIAAFFIAALTFSTSCSKKSSDEPKPATTTTPTPVASEKPKAPNTAKRETTDPVDGTGRPPLTDISVGGVMVQDQENQRKDMTVENQGKLDGLTGKGTTNGRFAETSTTDFGWMVADMTIDGTALSDALIDKAGLRSILFFNIDESGYYWQFDTDSSKWSWGTYGVDADMTTIAFDFNEENESSTVWKISKITKDRFVISGTFNIDEDVQLENVVIGLNAFDLTDDKYSGETEKVPGQEQFVGSWQQLTEDIKEIEDPISGEIKYDTTYYTSDDYLYVNVDGTYEIAYMSGGQVTPTENGSWVLENIPSTKPDVAPVYLLTATYGDLQTITVANFGMTIVSSNGVNYMVMVNQDTEEVLYFQKNK